jgi:hypothetical protein
LSKLPVYYTGAALLGSGLALASVGLIVPPAPVVAAGVTAKNNPAGEYKSGCRTGPDGEYTKNDFVRDTRGMPGIEVDWMIETFSLMNCGQPFSRYTLGDFMCHPKFKVLSWRDNLHIARITSLARCGH